MSLTDRWTSQLDDLRNQGRHRQLTLPCGIDFSSNDYLGYGKLHWQDRSDMSSSGGASRLLRGHHEIWDEVETRLAQWHRADAALVFSSGYAANEGLLSTVIEPGDWVASDEYNHASIIDGLRLAKAERFVFRHNDVGQLEDALRTAAARKATGRQLFVVTESLYGMEGDLVAPGIADVVSRYGANWIVDEAHATGCIGPTGAGVVEDAGWRERVLATVHTGGKALGVPGAHVCCSRLLKELLVNRCRHFIFTTALPPRVGAWWLEMLLRVQADDRARQRLHQNAKLFRETLAQHGVDSGSSAYIVAVILGEDRAAVAAAKDLQDRGFDIRAIRPPTVPAGTARLRVSIHADHEKAQLVAAAKAVADCTFEARGSHPRRVVPGDCRRSDTPPG